MIVPRWRRDGASAHQEHSRLPQASATSSARLAQAPPQAIKQDQSDLFLVEGELLLGDDGLAVRDDCEQVLRVDLAQVLALDLLELALLELAEGGHAGLGDDVPDLGGGEELEAVDDLAELGLRELVVDLLQAPQQQLAARVGVGRRQVDHLAEAALGGGVELLGQVGGPDDQHLSALGRVDTVHQHQELGLEAPRGLVLILGARREHRVDFVDEDDRGGEPLRRREDLLDRLLALAHQLVEDRRGREREEGAARLACQRLADQRLAVARRPVQQDAAGRSADAGVEVGPLAGADHGLLQHRLHLLQPHDVAEPHVQLPHHRLCHHRLLLALPALPPLVPQPRLLPLRLHALYVDLLRLRRLERGGVEAPEGAERVGDGEAEAGRLDGLVHLQLALGLGLGPEGLELGDLVAQLLDGLLRSGLPHQLPQHPHYLLVAPRSVLVVALRHEVLRLRGQRLRQSELFHQIIIAEPSAVSLGAGGRVFVSGGGGAGTGGFVEAGSAAQIQKSNSGAVGERWDIMIQTPEMVWRGVLKAALVLSAVLHLSACAPFQRYSDYREYLARWKAIVPAQHVHDVSHLALDAEQCYGAKCEFFYFESPAQQGQQGEQGEQGEQTVLLVSGMHGDEFIGPHALLYAYPHLRGPRIVYFPMANPSGFLQRRRNTFPGEVDVNRDFPVDGNSVCYRATATHVLDLLFRKYRFDLTVALHNGGSEVAFNWGTQAHAAESHTPDYPILIDIALLLQRAGGHSASLGLTPFRVGTMDEVVYPAAGTFDDWAYAAGRVPGLTTLCSNYAYEPYPQDMANGLFFLLELGPKSAAQLGSEEGVALPPTSSSPENGFVARAVRMLLALMNVLRPRLDFSHEGGRLNLRLRGCKTAAVSRLAVFKQEGGAWLKVVDASAAITVEGDLRAAHPLPASLPVAAAVREGDLMRYFGSFTCDPEWQGKGTSSFARPRLFSVDIVQRAQMRQAEQEAETFSEKLLSPFGLGEDSFGVAAVLVVVVVAVVAVACRRCCRTKKVEKFQEVQFAGESEQQAEEGEEAGGDLHTARGGIIGM